MKIFRRIASFYIDGLRSMRLGRKLWAIVAVKFLILFLIFKLLFFPDVMKERFQNDAQRSDFILKQLTEPAKP
ncbi:DUF4492 domain-containing protein [Hydrogenimonas sp.]